MEVISAAHLSCFGRRAKNLTSRDRNTAGCLDHCENEGKTHLISVTQRTLVMLLDFSVRRSNILNKYSDLALLFLIIKCDSLDRSA